MRHRIAAVVEAARKSLERGFQKLLRPVAAAEGTLAAGASGSPRKTTGRRAPFFVRLYDIAKFDAGKPFRMQSGGIYLCTKKGAFVRLDSKKQRIDARRAERRDALERFRARLANAD